MVINGMRIIFPGIGIERSSFKFSRDRTLWTHHRFVVKTAPTYSPYL